MRLVAVSLLYESFMGNPVIEELKNCEVEKFLKEIGSM